MKKLLIFLALFPAFLWGQQVINLDPSSLGALNALLLLDQDIIWVSSGNTTGIETGTMIYPYNTIQEGLDAAAAGNVVLVIAGTYSEHLTMATNGVRLMTLEGQTVEVELLQSSNRGLLVTGDSVVIGGGSGMGFTFTADGGRMIELAANEVDCEISYNTIIVDGGGTIGVNVGAAGATRLKVKNNLFKVSTGTGGIYATKNLIDAEISGNEFIGEAMASGYAIQLSGFYGGMIKDNYIHADTTDGVKGFASGIFPHTNTTDAHVSDSLKIFNNVILNCANGVRLGHANNANMSEIYIYGNKIQWCTDGIEIYNDAQVLPATYDIYDNIFAANTTNINNQHATAPNVGLNEFDQSIAIRSITPGNVDLDYAASTADADETRHFDYAVTGTVDPAASANVNAGYFAYNKTAGSNGTYTINALEGVARSSYADEAGTFRGVYGRTYINADATSTMRTGVGGEFSARASYSGGTECVAEASTAFVGSRIWMAPYFTDATLSNINNFHGLWIYNEATAKKVTNAIRINDAGGTGGWTNGINLTDAIIGTSDLTLHNGATLFNSDANTLTITEPTVAVVGALQALKTTEQFRLSYDATNYLTVTLLDDGHTTFTTVDPDGAEADINFTPDGNVGIKTAAPSTALQVTGTTTTTDAIITNMATSNTTVLTPTATGQVDSLETVDLATEDFTVTGLWTFDNVVIDSADIDTANVDYLYVSEKALFDSAISVGSWGYTGEHIVLPEASSNTNAGLGIYSMVDYAATAGKVFAGTYSRALAMTTSQTNLSTIVGTESQFRLRDVNIGNGVHAGLWAYAEQSGTSTLSGAGTFDAISATVESEAGFSVGATEQVTGITIDGSIHASATINAAANFTGLYIKSNGKDWFDGIKITGATNAMELQNGATIDNTQTDTLELEETVVKVDGKLEVTGAVGAASLAVTGAVGAASVAATGTITGKTLVCLHTAATYVFASGDSCKNAAHFNNDADVIDFTLPPCEAGLFMLFYDIGGGVITIDTFDGTDELYLDGTSVGAGDAIDSPGVAGNFIGIMGIDDTRWVTSGRSGTWVDGGPD